MTSKALQNWLMELRLARSRPEIEKQSRHHLGTRGLHRALSAGREPLSTITTWRPTMAKTLISRCLCFCVCRA